MSIWDQYDIEQNVCYMMQLGPLSAWIRKIDDEIHIATQRTEESLSNVTAEPKFEICEQIPKDITWTRYIIENNAKLISLKPIMPDRAVLVRPEEPLKLPAGRKATFYVRIPIWVNIEIASSAFAGLCELPTIEQSNIWFGDAVSGELCYSLRSKARRKFIDFTPMSHRVICPVVIQNKSKETIDISRICIQSQHLNIYSAESLMWTNDIEITFQTDDYSGSIFYSNKPSELKPKAKLITTARVPKKKTLLKRSLGTFRIFGGF